MYEFWSDYIKPKYQEKVILCYMDTDSFVIYIVTEDDFYKDIADDVEKRFHSLNCINVNRSLPVGKKKYFFELMKDELSGKSIVEFVALRRKICSCLTIDG